MVSHLKPSRWLFRPGRIFLGCHGGGGEVGVLLLHCSCYSVASFGVGFTRSPGSWDGWQAPRQSPPIFHTHPLVFSYRKEQMQMDLVYNIQHILPHFRGAHSKLKWALPGADMCPGTNNICTSPSLAKGEGASHCHHRLK